MTGLIKLLILLLSIILFGKYFFLLGGLFTLMINSIKNIFGSEYKKGA